MLSDQGSFAFRRDDQAAEAALPASPPQEDLRAGDRPGPGRRTRLRQRAGHGLDVLTDSEMLELFIGRTQPRGDVKPLARRLLYRFGSLSGVFYADHAELLNTEGVGQATALDLKLLHESTLRMLRGELRRRPVISSWQALTTYARTAMAGSPREQFRVLFLDRKNQLILDEMMSLGTVDHAPVYPREVIRRALEVSASALILAHNHPSGDPHPSAADIDMTHQIIDAGRPLRITVHDHIIVGRDGVASLRSLGLL